jgi:hypothetical protein
VAPSLDAGMPAFVAALESRFRENAFQLRPADLELTRGADHRGVNHSMRGRIRPGPLRSFYLDRRAQLFRLPHISLENIYTIGV